MNQPNLHVGIDTSQAQLDIAIIPSNEFFSVTNNPDGIQKEIQWIDKQLDKLVDQVPQWKHDVDILKGL